MVLSACTGLWLIMFSITLKPAGQDAAVAACAASRMQTTSIVFVQYCRCTDETPTQSKSEEVQVDPLVVDC